nr:MAG TPA: hypothetical protein [Caudoviricetes sp.]
MWSCDLERSDRDLKKHRFKPHGNKFLGAFKLYCIRFGMIRIFWLVTN